VATIAAMSQIYELEKYLILNPDYYIAECEAEFATAFFECDKKQLEINIAFARQMPNQLPAIVEEIKGMAKTYRIKTADAVDVLLNFCRKVVNDWLEFIPDKNVKALLAELDSLQRGKNIAAQLKWFGLTDFIPHLA
jgi:hypothetical protein